MSDRFYINTTNLVTFSAGERPSADKFNAVNRYFKRGLESLSKAIGDIHDTGVPHSFGSTDERRYLTNLWNPSSGNNVRPLDILNLARIIGPASNLNPRMLNRTTMSNVQETIPQGVTEYYTKFKTKSTYIDIEIAGLTYKLNDDFDSSNQYHFDNIKSRYVFAEPTTTTYTVEYAVSTGEISGGPNYTDAEYNVIPDPNTPSTSTSNQLTIIEVSGDYEIQLPVVAYQQSNLTNLDDANIDTTNPNNGMQIKIPKWLQGTTPVLPSGIVHLKNVSTGETFTDATYTIINDSKLKVSGVELCLTDGHQFCLIFVGTDITTSIDDLRTKWFLHKHDGAFGEPRVSIYDLADIFKYAPPSGIYRKSTSNWNVTPQYLHRDGYRTGEDTTNGNNAMRGNLMMGLTSYNPLTSKDIIAAGAITGSTYKVCFGNENIYLGRFGSYFYVYNSIDNIKIQSNSNDVVLEAGNDLKLSATNEIAINDSIKIKSANLSNLTTDYVSGTIFRYQFDILEKNFLFEKEKLNKNISEPEVTLSESSGVTLQPTNTYNVGSGTSLSINASYAMVKDEGYNYQKPIVRQFFDDSNYKSGSMISLADFEKSFFLDFNFFPSGTDYYKFSVHKYGATSAAAKYEVSLVDTYVFIYRGMSFQSYANDNMYSKNKGYIRSMYGPNDEITNQGSVNIDFKYLGSNNAPDIQMKKEPEALIANIWTSANTAVGSDYDSTIAVEFANNHINYILDYRIGNSNNVYKDPESTSWALGTSTPNKIIVNANLKYNGWQYAKTYATGIPISYSTIEVQFSSFSETIDYRNLIKGGATYSGDIFESRENVNLTAIFIDMILNYFSSLYAANPTPYFISKSFDFDIEVTEEFYSDILVLTINFINVKEIN